MRLGLFQDVTPRCFAVREALECLERHGDLFEPCSRAPGTRTFPEAGALERVTRKLSDRLSKG